MSTPAQRREIIDEFFTRMINEYKERLQKSETMAKDTEDEFQRIDATQKPYKQQELVRLADRLKTAYFSSYVNRELASLASNMKEIGLYAADISLDLEKVEEAVTKTRSKVDRHDKTIVSLDNHIAERTKEREANKKKYEENEKKLDDLRGKMYG